MAEPSPHGSEGVRRERLVDARFVLAIGVNFCIAAIFYLLVTTMALYALEVFRTDELVAGVVAGAFVVGSIAARLIGGKFVDVLGRRRTLIACLAACIALALAQLAASELWVVVVLQGLLGSAFGAASNAVSTGAFSLIPAARRAEGVGYYGLSTTIGSAAGPLIGTILIAQLGYPALFLATAGWAVVGLAGALALRLPERELDDADRAALRSWGLWTFLDRRSFPVASLMVAVGITFSGVLSFVNPYSVAETGVAVGGAYFALYAAVVFVARLFVGRIQDRFGDDAVVYPLFGCLAAGTGILAFGVDGWIPYVSAVLVAFGFASVGMGVTSYFTTFQQMEWIMFVLMPMFMFSATFFPISVYPEPLQWLVMALPLWHGVELIRGFTTGAIGPDALVHVLYYLVMIAIGLFFTTRRLRALFLD